MNSDFPASGGRHALEKNFFHGGHHQASSFHQQDKLEINKSDLFTSPHPAQENLYLQNIHQNNASQYFTPIEDVKEELHEKYDNQVPESAIVNDNKVSNSTEDDDTKFWMSKDSESDQGLMKIWENYRAFEDFHYAEDRDLDEFLREWKEKMKRAEAAGCQYSDNVLAFKLLEKTQLDPTFVLTIVRSLTYPVQDQSLLSQTFAKLQLFLAEVKTEEEPREDEGLPLSHDSSPKSVDQDRDLYEVNVSERKEVNGIEAQPSVTTTKSRLDKKLFKCKICKRKFTTVKGYHRHMASEHGDESNVHVDNAKGTYVCEKCDKEFSSRVDLFVHQKEHSGDAMFKCEVCDQSFLDKSSMKDHVKIHAETRDFPCKVCKKSFKQKIALQVHMRRHTGEKPFVCDDCGRAFAQQSTWKDHKRRHTGEKPYQCEDCGQTFAHSSGYRCHRRLHTGEKPYKCEHCERAFRQPGGLIEHLKTHTGEKPFTCQVCGRAFVTSTHLKRHLKTHRAKNGTDILP